MAADNERFTFHPVQRDVFKSLNNNNKEILELFDKWGLQHSMKICVFSYNKHFQLYQKSSFVEDFFNSDVVNSLLETPSSSGTWAPLSRSTDIDNVINEEVPCNIMSMEFFDRLLSSGVVHSSGSITKCFDEMYDDFLVSDELRKMLLVEDSDHYSLYSTGDRRELLFRVFQHLVLGGPVNQYEDTIKPYMDTAKQLYKELILVVKDSVTKKLSIATTVLKVQARVGAQVVFPSHRDHTQNFCYLLIDNIKRHVTVWYHIWH